MNDNRIQAWFDGDISDSELTRAEVQWLEMAVFDAIADKKLNANASLVFSEHEVLQ
jgi:hypothetical protein